ncbi:MAG: tRNA (adenosine(37)-N6)-threonylcarbamoyltransferase complex ATPase subunit type 1 TsaE [Candidatus Dormiibacterota bacterium]
MAMAFSTSEALQPLVLRSHSDEETRTIGRRIGAGLRPGDCLALKGEMGAGKTVTAQGIVQGAGGGADVRSPTFLLHAIYAGRVTIHHLDLYRLGAGVDLRMLGVDEALLEGAVIVEWPERSLGDWFTGEIALEITSESERVIHLGLRSGFGIET